jgi:CBS domain-containing protein
MIVDSLMHRPVVGLDAGATVREAAAHMERHRVGCLVVTRGDEAVGIVTERDIVFRVVGAGRDPDATRLADVMSAPIVTVSPDASVDEAAATMKRLRIKRLVVLGDGEARGVISVTDIAYASPEASRAMLDAWVKQRWED